MVTKERAEHDVIVIGIGFSGIGMAIELQKMGQDFIVLEEASDIGGTWHLNTYPGVACDIPSHFYSFSFEPKADWKHLYSYGGEIHAYLNSIVDKYKLRQHVKLNTRVARAYWDNDSSRWHVITQSGDEYVAQFLVSGVGALHIPLTPEFQDRDVFTGPAFHSAQWDHSVDLTGKRVAVIGTGASAIQIVPGIIRKVKELHLYQRTPAWVLPFGNPKISPQLQQAFSTVPGLRKAFRFSIYALQEALGYGMTKHPALLKGLEMVAKSYMRRVISDSELREKLTPTYRAGCKRLGKSVKYMPALANPKSTVITDGIDRFTERGIVAGGIEREVDVIVYATGFHVTDSINSLDITGADGTTLADLWDREGMQTLRGVTVAGWPNLFILLGPNTGLGHNSVIYMIESQIKYVSQAIKAVRKTGAQAIMPKRSAQDRFNEDLQRKLEGSVWNTGGCASYYLDKHGKNRTLWSGFTWQYRLAVRKLKPGEYEFLG